MVNLSCKLYFFFSNIRTNKTVYLGNQSGSSAGFVFPVGCNLWFAFVVSCQTVDTWFNQNQTEFGISVFPEHEKIGYKVIIGTIKLL